MRLRQASRPPSGCLLPTIFDKAPGAYACRYGARESSGRIVPAAAAPTASRFAFVATPAGPGVYHHSVSSGEVRWEASDITTSQATPLCIVMFFWITPTATATLDKLLIDFGRPGTRYSGLTVKSTQQWAVAIPNNQGHRPLVSASTFVPNKATCVVARMSTASGLLSKLWVDGVEEDSLDMAGATIGYGQHTSLRYNSDASTKLIFHVFGRWQFIQALASREYPSDSLLANLSANPTRLFAPREIWIPTTSGGPTLSLPTYMPGSLTSVGFRPRVTAT